MNKDYFNFVYINVEIRMHILHEILLSKKEEKNNDTEFVNEFD